MEVYGKYIEVGTRYINANLPESPTKKDVSVSRIKDNKGREFAVSLMRSLQARKRLKLTISVPSQQYSLSFQCWNLQMHRKDPPGFSRKQFNQIFSLENSPHFNQSQKTVEVKNGWCISCIEIDGSSKIERTWTKEQLNNKPRLFEELFFVIVRGFRFGYRAPKIKSSSPDEFIS